MRRYLGLGDKGMWKDLILLKLGVDFG